MKIVLKMAARSVCCRCNRTGLCRRCSCVKAGLKCTNCLPSKLSFVCATPNASSGAPLKTYRSDTSVTTDAVIGTGGVVAVGLIPARPCQLQMDMTRLSFLHRALVILLNAHLISLWEPPRFVGGRSMQTISLMLLKEHTRKLSIGE